MDYKGCSAETLKSFESVVQGDDSIRHPGEMSIRVLLFGTPGIVMMFSVIAGRAG
jgi:hypothetical protein